MRVEVISRLADFMDKAVTVGTYATLGLLRTRDAWQNAVLLAGGFALFIAAVNANRSIKAAMKRRTARAAAASLGLKEA